MAARVCVKTKRRFGAETKRRCVWETWPMVFGGLFPLHHGTRHGRTSLLVKVADHFIFLD